MLFYSGYRCRNCHERFFRLAGGPLVAAVAVLLFVLATGFGWGLRSIYTAERSDSVPVASAPTPESMDLESAMPPAPVAADSTAALAERGDAKAQFQLGMSYRNGQADSQDSTLAYKWIAQSAQQGHADAQYVVGTMHLAGHGVLQSFPTAIEWFERAAQQNHADAQYNLGRMYRRGYGIAASNTKAYMWFNLAAAQGHDRAREARDNLLPLMTPDQIKAAQHDSQEWRPVAAK